MCVVEAVCDFVGVPRLCESPRSVVGLSGLCFDLLSEIAGRCEELGNYSVT